MAKKFFLRTKETKGRASLYIEVRKRTPNIRALVCTNIPVDIQTWTRVNKSPKVWETFRQTKDGKALSDKLDLIEAAINDTIANGIDIDGIHYDIEDGNSSLNSMVLNTAVDKIVMKDIIEMSEKSEPCNLLWVSMSISWRVFGTGTSFIIAVNTTRNPQLRFGSDLEST